MTDLIRTLFDRQSAQNMLINGAFDFWQRGVTVTSTNSARSHLADRFWYFNNTDSPTPNTTHSRSTDVPLNGAFEYSMRVQRNSGNTNTAGVIIGQSIETVNVRPLRGRQMTLTFWAKAGANYSPTSSALNVRVRSGTGVDEDPGGTYTGQIDLLSENVTLTSNWQRFNRTITVPVNSSEISVQWRANHTGTAGADDSFYITGCMLVTGIGALMPFVRAGGTIGGELTLCQRYYEKSYDLNTAPGTVSITAGSVRWANATGTVSASHVFLFKVPRRTSSYTAVIYSPVTGATGNIRNGSDGVDQASQVASGSNGQSGATAETTAAGVANKTYLFHWSANAEI